MIKKWFNLFSASSNECFFESLVESESKDIKGYLKDGTHLDSVFFNHLTFLEHDKRQIKRFKGMWVSFYSLNPSVATMDTLSRICDNLNEGDIEIKLYLKNEKVRKRILCYEPALNLLGYIGFQVKDGYLLILELKTENLKVLKHEIQVYQMNRVFIKEKESKNQNITELITIRDRKSSEYSDKRVFKSYQVEDLELIKDKQFIELPEQYQYLSVISSGYHGFLV